MGEIRRSTSSTKSDPVIDEFVKHNWVSLAGAGYRYYLQNGRGAMFVDFQVLDRWKADEAFTVEPLYVTTIDDDEVERMVAIYDPETSIVIGFTDDKEALRTSSGKWRTLQKDSRMSVWTYRITPRPPEAHRITSH